jgi:hypothetical protein
MTDPIKLPLMTDEQLQEVMNWAVEQARPNNGPVLAIYGREVARIAVEQDRKRQVHFDLIKHLRRHIAFSARTFGPGPRIGGVLDHIRKELREIEADPTDLTEWCDVMMLAFDGAWRAGYSPEQIAQAIEAKQTKNEGRQWPDWRTVPDGQAIEHVRDGAAS